MKAWLQRVLDAGRGLPEELEGYLLGRALREDLIRELGAAVWTLPGTPAPDPEFRERYGDQGQVLRDRVVFPFYSPRGELLGIEVRTWRWNEEKRITDYRLPEAHWNPVFIGLTPTTMQRLWKGGNAWVVEGVYDLSALERVTPQTDAVLATVKAGMSRSHVEFFRRHIRDSQVVNVVYDRDETGRKQTHGWVDDTTGKKRWGALSLLDGVGVKCRDVPYAGGKDPGEVWDHGGKAGLQQAFERFL